MKKKAPFQGLFLILLCITGNFILISAQPPIDVPTDDAGGDAGDDARDEQRVEQFEINNDLITFSVTGLNIPMYSFWLSSQETIKYEVKFLLLFEIVDQNQDGIYTPDVDSQVPESIYALPSLSWEFSDSLDTADNSTHFNLTSTGGPFTIQFRHHFSQNSHLKFDIVIQNYTFVSDEENAMLVLGFHLLSSEQGEDNDSKENQENLDQSNEKRINFGNQGYFSSMKTASSNGTDIQVGVSEGKESGEPIAYLAFEKFSDTVILDPKIGIDLSAPPLPFPLETIALYIIIGSVMIGIIFSLMMTKQEYRQFILNRIRPIPKKRHNLSIEEVLENEKRDEIIEIILHNPGIHFNELRRHANISSGNLVWHIDILDSYKIIKKDRIGQYVVYYPYYDKNPISNVDFLIQKSTATMKILQIVVNNPGIYQNQIASKCELNRSTVKYHLDKLLKAEVIYSTKNGQKKSFFVN